MRKNYLSLLYGFCVAVILAGQGWATNNSRLSDEQLAEMSRGVDPAVTNNIPKWVDLLSENKKSDRLKGISNLFVGSLLAKDELSKKDVGSRIVKAYEVEIEPEIKVAMLATLDVLQHSDLSRLLAVVEKDKDPVIRNIANIIREKQYLGLLIMGDPDLHRNNQKKSIGVQVVDPPENDRVKEVPNNAPIIPASVPAENSRIQGMKSFEDIPEKMEFVEQPAKESAAHLQSVSHHNSDPISNSSTVAVSTNPIQEPKGKRGFVLPLLAVFLVAFAGVAVWVLRKQ